MKVAHWMAISWRILFLGKSLPFATIA
jgi:hypothetical protein